MKQFCQQSVQTDTHGLWTRHIKRQGSQTPGRFRRFIGASQRGVFSGIIHVHLMGKTSGQTALVASSDWPAAAAAERPRPRSCNGAFPQVRPGAHPQFTGDRKPKSNPSDRSTATLPKRYPQTAACHPQRFNSAVFV